MLRYSFAIWVIIMGVMFTYHLENEGNYTKPIKEWNDHDTTHIPTWQNPKNIKQIKKKYKL